MAIFCAVFTCFWSVLTCFWSTLICLASWRVVGAAGCAGAARTSATAPAAIAAIRRFIMPPCRMSAAIFHVTGGKSHFSFSTELEHGEQEQAKERDLDGKVEPEHR